MSRLHQKIDSESTPSESILFDSLDSLRLTLEHYMYVCMLVSVPKIEFFIFQPSLCHLELNFSLMDLNTLTPSLNLQPLQIQILPQILLLPLLTHWKVVHLPRDQRDSKLAILNLLTIAKKIAMFKHWMSGKL